MAGAELSTTEELIQEARNGRMFILMDDEDRENEGDLVIPGQMATPDAINFMAKFGRGLICLAITQTRAAELGLELMGRNSDTRYGTAFATSIEAAEGVSTGISAADRARTIATAINTSNGPNDLKTPGHVFPLIARDGGVLTRAGHTEAAVDFARLAGLNPSGVICEIMSEDGTMARTNDLLAFAQQHGLKIGTIRDLIAFRLRNDHLVSQTAEAPFQSRWGGSWTAKTFWISSLRAEQLALVHGNAESVKPTLVRMHQLDVLYDALLQEDQRSGLLQGAIKAIEENGSGVIVVINRAVSGHFKQQLDIRSGKIPADNVKELRDYGVGAQILAALGVEDMVLLTNSHHTPVALAAFGLRIVGERRVARTEFRDL